MFVFLAMALWFSAWEREVAGEDENCFSGRLEILTSSASQLRESALSSIAIPDCEDWELCVAGVTAEFILRGFGLGLAYVRPILLCHSKSTARKHNVC